MDMDIDTGLSGDIDLVGRMNESGEDVINEQQSKIVGKCKYTIPYC